MTVKCLSAEQKLSIVNNYVCKALNQKQLAEAYLVSERTINRVLNQAGVATAVPRLKGEAYQVMQILKKHNVSVQELDMLLSGQLYALQECLNEFSA